MKNCSKLRQNSQQASNTPGNHWNAKVEMIGGRENWRKGGFTGQAVVGNELYIGGGWLASGVHKPALIDHRKKKRVHGRYISHIKNNT